MVKAVYIKIFALLLALTAAQPVSAQLLKDNGTGVDGVFILPKRFAMRCDISSYDVKKDDVVRKCLNQILRMKLGSQTYSEGYDFFFVQAFHEINNKYIDIAVQRKARAGDVVDEIKQALKVDKSVDGAYADNSGEEKDSAEVMAKKNQFVKLTALGAKNVVDIIDVYSSQLALNAMRYYHQYEFSDDSAPVPSEEDDI